MSTRFLETCKELKQTHRKELWVKLIIYQERKDVTVKRATFQTHSRYISDSHALYFRLTRVIFQTHSCYISDSHVLCIRLFESTKMINFVATSGRWASLNVMLRNSVI